MSDLFPIAIAVAAGAAVSAIGLGTRSLWLDEGSTFAIASQHGSALWHAVSHDGGNMLAYYLLMHVVIAWFGHAAWVLRLPSVVANAATGGLVAAIALRLFADRRLATAAGLLTVISLPLVAWGQNARGYALLVTLSVGSFLALVAILQAPAGDRPSSVAIAAYVLSTVAALYVGYDAALLIPAQLVLLLVFRRTRPARDRLPGTGARALCAAARARCRTRLRAALLGDADQLAGRAAGGGDAAFGGHATELPHDGYQRRDRGCHERGGAGRDRAGRPRVAPGRAADCASGSLLLVLSWVVVPSGARGRAVRRGRADRAGRASRSW